MYVSNLLVQLCHLLLLQYALVFYRYNLDELFAVVVPVVEHAACQCTAGVQIVLAYEFEQLLAAYVVLNERELHHVHIAEVVEVVMTVPDVCHTAAHAGSEVSSGVAEHYHATACHVFAAVVAGTLDDGNGTRVAHSEALTHTAVDIELAAGGTVEASIAGDDVVFCTEVLACAYWRQYADATAGEALAEVVVALALKSEVNAAHGKSAERLACIALELNLDSAVGQTCLTVFLGYRAREHGGDGTVGILDGIVEVHLFFLVYCLLGCLDDFLILDTADLGELATVPIESLVGLRLVEQTTEVYRLLLVGGICGIHLDEVGTADNLLQAVNTNLAEVLAHLLCKEGKEVYNIVGAALEMLAQFWILRCHTHRTGVGVTLTHHHTTEHDERQCAE